jgi:putative CocE/NonD family hydrolase
MGIRSLQFVLNYLYGMKKIMRLVWVALLFVQVGMAQQLDSLWMAEHYEKEDAQIGMRDGVRLYTCIYRPKSDAELHPMLMCRTPYSAEPYGAGRFRNFKGQNYEAYLKAGYILVFQDVRGRYMSEGEFEDVRPFLAEKNGKQTDEASDTYDTIEWLLKNIKGNNGKVGVMGISYPGFYSTLSGLSGHPALKAVSPQAPVTNWFIGDDFHHNGALMLLDAFSFYKEFGRPRLKPYASRPRGKKLLEGPDSYLEFLKTGALQNFSGLLGDSIRFWNQLVEHPNYDAYWKSTDPRPHMRKFAPAALVVGGLFDAEDCWGAFATYQAIAGQQPKSAYHLVMGPWFHGQWSGKRGDGTRLGHLFWGSNTNQYYLDALEFPFFERWLRDKKEGVELPRATIFFTGENVWRNFSAWPPTDVIKESWWLKPQGGLDAKRGDSTNLSPYTIVSFPEHPVPYTDGIHSRRTREYMLDDQRFASCRPDVMTFTGEPLAGNLTLAGPVEVDFSVMLNSSDADLVVKLVDVFPDDFSYPDSINRKGDAYPMGGYQMMVRWEVMRLKYRNNLEKPEPMPINKPTRVRFTLPDVAHTFQRGHKIMIQIQGSMFPLVDRNPQVFTDVYRCTDSAFQAAEISIIPGSSRVLLPVQRR